MGQMTTVEQRVQIMELAQAGRTDEQIAVELGAARATGHACGTSRARLDDGTTEGRGLGHLSDPAARDAARLATRSPPVGS